jgi:serine/threonine-protein kinase HipA
MRSQILLTLLEGQIIGTVARDGRGRLAFKYAEDWRTSPDAYPLSLSLPLATSQHRSAPIEAYLWGLLPDNEQILQRWAQRFKVSPRSVYSLISNVGEDCAGAVQFATPDRLAAITRNTPGIEWLSESGVAERLRILRKDHSAWRIPRDTGQFSLAGAQPKTALFFDNGRWGVPSGRTPTTHILKPPSADFDGHAENEHFSLTLARALKLPAATSEVRDFAGEAAIVVERYDRVRSTATIRRVHQEDLCQALGLQPTAKYQNEGGPSPETIVALLAAYSTRPEEDIGTFIDALIFNWLIGGTDAHAKNYSILHGNGGKVRLAPLYDVASALPYPDIDPKKIKLAMKIGGDYRLRDIGARQWRKLAADLRRKPEEIVDRVAALAESMRAQVPIIAEQVKQNGLTHPIIDRLAAALTERTELCLRLMRL